MRPGSSSRHHCTRRLFETLEWLFPERKRLAGPGAAPADARYLKVAGAFRTSRYRALYQQWLDDPRNTLWMAGSTVVADAIDRELGQRVERVLVLANTCISRPWLTSPDPTAEDDLGDDLGN